MAGDRRKAWGGVGPGSRGTAIPTHELNDSASTIGGRRRAGVQAKAVRSNRGPMRTNLRAKQI